MPNYISRLIINNPKRTLTSVFILTIIFSFFIPNLKIDFSIEHLFSQNDPSVEKYFSFRDSFGREDNVITLIYKPKDIYAKELYIELEELVYAIEELGEVKSTVSVFNMSDLDEKAWIGDLYDLDNDSKIWKKETIEEKLKYIQMDPSVGSRILSKNQLIKMI